MTIQEYIDSINKRFKLGNATEHTFRGDLQNLIESLVPEIRATNEPKRQACGAPDYIITKKDIPVGFIEAKDIGDKDLLGAKTSGNKEQFDRYKASLNNIIFTDYLSFHLFRDSNLSISISIGEITTKGIMPLNQNFEQFERIIKEFCTFNGQTIRSSKKLAEMMAGKARLLANVIETALNSDNSTEDRYKQNNNTLFDQYNSFKDILIHDITIKAFSDIYAQTIAYGMFAARLHDTTLDDFTRREAAELIPKSNPFLRKLFQYIAGYDLDDRIKWIVDALADIFRATNVAELLADFGKSTQQNDPIIHFYETFLTEYDPKLKKQRGVWYTPEPVVNFIVRAVDDILKTEFDLPMGLADTSKTKIKVKLQESDKRYNEGYKTIEQEVHRVQILDPATGTGTFLAEVIKQIYKNFEGMQGVWNQYVDEHLIPRLNGFELLMASYAMAHLKLDLLLKETGYVPKTDQRFNVYLTNSLEEHHKDTGTLFASWLSNEANEANRIKRDTPVMVIIGNPPYSVSSSNKSEWIEGLLKDYKKDLNEKNIQPLSDDYIKFIRFGQHFIEKNGSGILAYISNNSFIDGIIHRQMRKNLLGTFDKIYILDLHGNIKREEVCSDGSLDQNVFDIMQGVSINLFIKNNYRKDKSTVNDKNKQCKLFHFSLLDKRKEKYNFLQINHISAINWNILETEEPNFYFLKKEFKDSINYYNYFKLDSLFNLNSVGMVTARDSFTIQYQQDKLEGLIMDFMKDDPETARAKFSLGEDARDWKVSYAQNDLLNNFPNNGQFLKIDYRPFDKRFTYYTGKSKGFHSYPRFEIMQHLLQPNIAIIAPKQAIKGFKHIFISSSISDKNFIDTAGQYGAGNIFPLYIYRNKISNELYSYIDRAPNLKMEIVNEIATKLGLTFTNEKEASEGTFAPIDILDYIYAVLHSPAYREKYKEFLKIDFPRVPYPTDKDKFWQLVKLGGEIRQIHLLESEIVSKRITTYPEAGDNEVIKPEYKDGKVWINKTQYFAGVPEIAWNFYIGGYQPAQKWLKDRKGRSLSFEDIIHYQKIIVALTETDRLMKEIDEIGIE